MLVDLGYHVDVSGCSVALGGARPLGVCCSLVQHLVICQRKYYTEVMFSGFIVMYSIKLSLKLRIRLGYQVHISDRLG